ncbi:MAG: phytanoyl-CoA dioxygenase family protein [Nostocaceae cyanobacterium]|nr:phytanoyl-CoA dioxygenase family protein [Nostocaceae cyanobacterium]
MIEKMKHTIFLIQAEFAYRAALIKHATPRREIELSHSDRAIVDTLKKEGACITSLDALGLTTTDEMLKTAGLRLSNMATTSQAIAAKRPVQIHTVTDLAEFSVWGLEPRLQNIVESYIGLPITFHGVHLRKDFPYEKQQGTLLWHKDAEDRRIVKIIVYLSDVASDNGPFEYVPRNLTSLLRLSYWRITYKLWKSGYLGITNEEFNQIIPKSSWKSCPGTAGTVIFVDTRNAIHHGTLRNQERSALFFVYTAKDAKRPELCTQYWDETFARPELRQKANLVKPT